MTTSDEKNLEITLPADWLREHELVEGDEVVLTFSQNRILVQTSKQNSESPDCSDI